MVSMLDNFFIPKEMLLTTLSDEIHKLIIDKNLKEVADADVASTTFSNWEDIKQSQSALDLYFGRADGTVVAVPGWKPEDKLETQRTIMVCFGYAVPGKSCIYKYSY